MFFSKTGMREYCSWMTSWRSSSSVASAEMATILGRGVITSRTTLSPNSTTDWISLRSSSSINPSSCAGGNQRLDVFRRSGLLLVGVGESSARSISDWKKPRTATQGRATQARPRSSGTSGSSQWPEVRR